MEWIMGTIVILLGVCWLIATGVAIRLLIEGSRLEKTILELNKMQSMIDDVARKERENRW